MWTDGAPARQASARTDASEPRERSESGSSAFAKATADIAEALLAKACQGAKVPLSDYREWNALARPSDVATTPQASQTSREAPVTTRIAVTIHTNPTVLTAAPEWVQFM